ncbi:MAG TPA: single-stranded-DNA-specific exonuclease RecJ [Chloroflexota bacterium]|nr:single-stranded-DNA-specific exonuclease RecJ [Chloroflexota bacterium]
MAPGPVVHRPKRWNIAEPPPAELQASLPDVHPLLLRLLYNRGVTQAEDFQRFHAASYADLHDPFLMPHMEHAVDRLFAAARQGEVVCVYGDFDADGVTGSAILHRALGGLGMTPRSYIPKRLEEGYGLHQAALEALANDGVRVVITVDCGITSVDEIARASELGMDVIVCDHHKLPAELPPALALLHPGLGGYPFASLCAAGVAFKLAQALYLAAPRSVPEAVDPELLTDFAAIGTLADMVPLQGENRVIVQQGLERLRSEPSFGLRTMIELAGIDQRRLTCGDVSFSLAPHINASGRLDDASLAFRLMVTRDEAEAGELAARLRELNLERQRLTQQVLAAARLQVLAADPGQLAYVVAGEGWTPGVVGLVAGRLTEEFGRPVFAMELGADVCRGSARSVAGFDLVEAMGTCAALLTRFGGHARAAGFTLPRAAYEDFSRRIVACAGVTLTPRDVEPALEIDSELKPRHLNWDIYRAVQQAAPFGTGNPTPLFLIRGLRAQRASAAGNHLRLTFLAGRQVIDGFAYGLGDCASEIRRQPELDVVFELNASGYKGYETLELRVRDWCGRDNN